MLVTPDNFLRMSSFNYLFQESDSGDKSDGDLVVDVGNEDESGRQINGDHRGGENGNADRRERPPSNMSSSSRSTPSLKQKDLEKPGTPGSKPATPNDLAPGQKAPTPPRGPPHGPQLPGAGPYPYPGLGGRPPGDPLGYPPGAPLGPGYPRPPLVS